MNTAVLNCWEQQAQYADLPFERFSWCALPSVEFGEHNYIYKVYGTLRIPVNKTINVSEIFLFHDIMYLCRRVPTHKKYVSGFATRYGTS